MKRQTRLVLRHLETVGPLRQGEALRLYGTMRLGARIYELRRLGYEIYAEMVSVRTRHGRARVAQYSLV